MFFYFLFGKLEDLVKCEVMLEKVVRIFKFYKYGIFKEEFGVVVKVWYFFNVGVNIF